MIYEKALNILINKQSLGIKPGLERVSALLEEMGNPQNELKIIHIAGTNGKGTVACTIADTLIENGFNVGLFTSPWIIDYREQIQLNGDFITEEELAYYVETYQHNDCTEFEMLTAIMYRYFADKKVDYAVVECGMGGANDSTNVEKENLAVITSIALDHTDFLGDTIEKIALEKAGIIKENCTCVLYPNPDVEYIFEQVCKEKNAKLVKAEDMGFWTQNNLETAYEVLKSILGEVDIPLAHLPARTEKINNIILDGGHNADAAKFLEYFIDDEVAVIGMMKDKDIESYLSIIAPKCKKIITTTPSNSRALFAEKLAEIAQKYCKDVMVIENPADAVKQNGVTLVCGSFFLARDVRNTILNM